MACALSHLADSYDLISEYGLCDVYLIMTSLVKEIQRFMEPML